MAEELLKQLLEAGTHFGHQTKRWNPKMAPYIFGERNAIYIIDLEKTVECLRRAQDFLRELARKGDIVLFAGTKRQAQDIIKEQAQACGMYWVSHRWLGGLLTNFSTIKKSIARLKEIEKMEKDGLFKSFTKKEVSLLLKEREKLERNLGGIKDMERLPSALYVVDSKKEELVVKEAKKMGIPVVALIDTNCNPEVIDYPIPGNDDALKSIRLITTLIAEAVASGRKGFLEYLAQVNIKPQVPLAGQAEELAVAGGEAEDIKVKEEIVELAEQAAGVDKEEEMKKPLKAKAADIAPLSRMRRMKR